MTDTLHPTIQRILSLMKERGMTPNGLSAKAGLDRNYIRKLSTGRGGKPKYDTTVKLAAALECSADWLLTGDGEEQSNQPGNAENGKNVVIFPSQSPPTLASMQNLPRDVPVMGTAAGAVSGSFNMKEGLPINYVDRPPGIAKARNVYALYVEGSSMEPRFFPGELIYVHPDLPARAGDFVVVTVETGTEKQFFVKKLAKQPDDVITCEQFNPPMTHEFVNMSKTRCDRILTMNELHGA